MLMPLTPPTARMNRKLGSFLALAVILAACEEPRAPLGPEATPQASHDPNNPHGTLNVFVQFPGKGNMGTPVNEVFVGVCTGDANTAGGVRVKFTANGGLASFNVPLNVPVNAFILPTKDDAYPPLTADFSTAPPYPPADGVESDFSIDGWVGGIPGTKPNEYFEVTPQTLQTYCRTPGNRPLSFKRDGETKDIVLNFIAGTKKVTATVRRMDMSLYTSGPVWLLMALDKIDGLGRYIVGEKPAGFEHYRPGLVIGVPFSDGDGKIDHTIPSASNLPLFAEILDNIPGTTLQTALTEPIGGGTLGTQHLGLNFCPVNEGEIELLDGDMNDGTGGVELYDLRAGFLASAADQTVDYNKIGYQFLVDGNPSSYNIKFETKTDILNNGSATLNLQFSPLSCPAPVSTKGITYTVFCQEVAPGTWRFSIAEDLGGNQYDLQANSKLVKVSVYSTVDGGLLDVIPNPSRGGDPDIVSGSVSVLNHIRDTPPQCPGGGGDDRWLSPGIG